MDYRLTDLLADPLDFDDAYTEKLYRLKDCFLCYEAFKNSPPVAQTPSIKNNHITFGSFNNLSKINDKVLKTWADILRKVPNSHLLIKNPGLTECAVREHYMAIFKNSDIAQERIILKGLSATTVEHLAEYNNIDIALDTFPYNGTTTTCEALWMGVPVLTLKGATHANCVGNSLLSAVGLTEWVAETTDDYISYAATFANKQELLEQQRMTMREKVHSSILCDGDSFARKIEAAYREIWLQWCS
jgi:predicted O-linked N-acetylglucosamine transferase (SPINDLY family)